MSREAFEINAVNHEIDAMKYILELDGYSYHMMNILDYLTGNTDRHWGKLGTPGGQQHEQTCLAPSSDGFQSGFPLL